MPEPAPVLDLRAETDEDSLYLLTLAAVSSLPEIAGSVECAVTLPRREWEVLMSGTSDLAMDVARRDQESGHGPVSRALAGQPAFIINGYTTDTRWPAYWEPLADAGYRSIASVPLMLEGGRVAALTLLADQDDVFTPSVQRRLIAFGHVAATSYAMAAELRTARATADQLRSAMQGRTSIDVACGVIMGQNRCSYEDAFQMLAKASSHRNVKVRLVAESILTDLPGGAPATHFKG
ncbi:ANTAR domain-containing protein [Arthrobacter sp. 9AX]|nr:ANTAR domain-containing protein [Arthrobacter sp. 9AX]